MQAQTSELKQTNKFKQTNTQAHYIPTHTYTHIHTNTKALSDSFVPTRMLLYTCMNAWLLVGGGGGERTWMDLSYTEARVLLPRVAGAAQPVLLEFGSHDLLRRPGCGARVCIEIRCGARTCFSRT